MFKKKNVKVVDSGERESGIGKTSGSGTADVLENL